MTATQSANLGVLVGGSENLPTQGDWLGEKKLNALLLSAIVGYEQKHGLGSLFDKFFSFFGSYQGFWLNRQLHGEGIPLSTLAARLSSKGVVSSEPKTAEWQIDNLLLDRSFSVGGIFQETIEFHKNTFPDVHYWATQPR